MFFIPQKSSRALFFYMVVKSLGHKGVTGTDAKVTGYDINRGANYPLNFI